MTRALVTGATGFLGGAIARRASSRGWEVFAVHRGGRRSAAMSRAEVTWVTLDEARQVPGGFDVAFHAAAQRHRHGVPPSQYAATNLALTEQVLEVARGRAGLFVHVSSIAVYGWPKMLPIDETRPYAPLGPYGESKALTERLVRESGIPFTIVQPSITYGPGDTNGMVEKMMRMIARHAFVMPGLGRTRVQLVYIDDFADMALAAVASPRVRGEAFICTYRDPIRIADLVSGIARAVGTWVPPFGPPVPFLRAAGRLFELAESWGWLRGEPPLTREKLATISVDRAYRIDKMRRLLGEEPRTAYAEGLARTAQFGSAASSDPSATSL